MKHFKEQVKVHFSFHFSSTPQSNVHFISAPHQSPILSPGHAFQKFRFWGVQHNHAQEISLRLASDTHEGLFPDIFSCFTTSGSTQEAPPSLIALIASQCCLGLHWVEDLVTCIALVCSVDWTKDWQFLFFLRIFFSHVALILIRHLWFHSQSPGCSLLLLPQLLLLDFCQFHPLCLLFPFLLFLLLFSFLRKSGPLSCSFFLLLLFSSLLLHAGLPALLLLSSHPPSASRVRQPSRCILHLSMHSPTSLARL